MVFLLRSHDCVNRLPDSDPMNELKVGTRVTILPTIETEGRGLARACGIVRAITDNDITVDLYRDNECTHLWQRAPFHFSEIIRTELLNNPPQAGNSGHWRW